MKKFLLITMCLVFVLSFAACTKDSAENNDAVVSDEVTTDNTAEETEADTTAEETTEAEPETAFDTSWATNDYEKLIPQPPMQIARSYQDGDNKWIITNLISGSKLAEDPKYPVTADAAKEDFLAYVDQLRTLGFIENGELYENKTEIQEVIGAFFKTPDEKYSVTVWYEDNYIFSITINEIIPEE